MLPDPLSPPQGPMQGPLQGPTPGPTQGPVPPGRPLAPAPLPPPQAIPLPPQEQQDARPIQLEGEDLERFKVRFRSEYHTARGRPLRDEDIALWRSYYRMERYRVESGEDGETADDIPNYTLPVLKGKIRGLTAAAKKQLNKDPFFTGRAYSDEARAALPAFEIMMERNLDLVRAKAHLFNAIKEAALTGCGFIGFSPAVVNGEVVTPLKAYRLENVWVSPLGVEELSQASIFVRAAEPMFMIRAKSMGPSPIYDPEAVALLRPVGTPESLSESERARGTQPHDPQSDVAILDIVESYFRFEDKLWRVFYEPMGNHFLHITPSWTEGVFNQPPFQPVRIEREVDSIIGPSLSAATEGSQEITDFAFNSHMAYQKAGIVPTVFADEQSEFFRANRDEGLKAGAIYGTRGDPRQSVHVVAPPQSQAALETIGLSQTVVDQATFPDHFFMGSPLRNVRSATEVSALNDAANALLGDFMEVITSDLADLASMLWATLYWYKVRREKVSSATRGDETYLVADETMDREEYARAFAQFAMQRFGLGPEEAAAAAAQVYQQNKIIPGVKRDDFEWLCNGAELVPDKLARAAKLRELMTMFPIIQASRQSKAIWNLLKAYLEDIDIPNWRKYLGEEPADEQMSLEDQMAFAQMIHLMRQGSAASSGMGGVQ